MSLRKSLDRWICKIDCCWDDLQFEPRNGQVPDEYTSAIRFSNLSEASKSPYWYSYRAQRSHNGRARSAGKFGMTRSKRARASEAMKSVRVRWRTKKKHTILIIDRNKEPEVPHDIFDFIPVYVETPLKNPARNGLVIRAVVFHQG
jgi:hypothetical protein